MSQIWLEVRKLKSLLSVMSEKAIDTLRAVIQAMIWRNLYESARDDLCCVDQ